MIQVTSPEHPTDLFFINEKAVRVLQPSADCKNEWEVLFTDSGSVPRWIDHKSAIQILFWTHPQIGLLAQVKTHRSGEFDQLSGCLHHMARKQAARAAREAWRDL